MTMTVQEAAYRLLSEMGKPMGSRAIAEAFIKKGWVHSKARDPVESLAQTLEKNIRDDIYNDPKLAFIPSPKGRLIGLPNWGGEAPPISSDGPSEKAMDELTIRLPCELLEHIQLAAQAKIAPTFEETVGLILRKGIAAIEPQIREGVGEQLNKLPRL